CSTKDRLILMVFSPNSVSARDVRTPTARREPPTSTPELSASVQSIDAQRHLDANPLPGRGAAGLACVGRGGPADNHWINGSQGPDPDPSWAKRPIITDYHTGNPGPPRAPNFEGPGRSDAKSECACSDAPAGRRGHLESNTR